MDEQGGAAAAPGGALLAWEHGRQLGHLARLAAIGAGLHARGVACDWVLPESARDNPLVRRHARRVLAAPALNAHQPSPAAPPPPPACFAGLLLGLGLGDAGALRRACARWLNLYRRLRPAIVVGDYAPVAQLAAAIAGIPFTQLSNGFDAPPPWFPPFMPAAPAKAGEAEARRRSEIANLEDAVHRLGRFFGLADLSMRGLMAATPRLLDVVPDCDPYGARGGIYTGPWLPEGLPGPEPWPGGRDGRPRVFAYLREPAGGTALLDVLAAMAVPTRCVWPRFGTGLGLRYAGTTVALQAHAVDLRAALAQTDAVLNYGSSAIACAALLAGKPQLMAPFDLEKRLLARRLSAVGAALAWTPGEPDAAARLDRLLNDPVLARVARERAARHPEGQLARRRAEVLDRLAAGCAA